VSDIIGLLDTVAGLKKVNETICANDYHQALGQHESYCKALGIEQTPWAIERRQKIVDAGLSSVYKSLPSEVRILSSDKIPEPSIPIHDLTSDDNITGATAEPTPSTVNMVDIPLNNQPLSEYLRDTRRDGTPSEASEGSNNRVC